MDISPWLCPQRQERGEKNVGSSSASACPQLRWPVFLLGSALPQALTSQELARTSFIVHVVPRTTQLLTTTTTTTVPRPHSKSAAELTLPQQCLCGSAQVPSIDQSVPAKSERRPSQSGINKAEPPRHLNHPVWADLPGTCHIQQGE